MTDFTLRAEEITKQFGRRLIFKKVNFILDRPGIYGVAGPNGSGKSTFVKILARLISPTRGSITHLKGGKPVEPEQLHNELGFVSPYLLLYDEFTAAENIRHFSDIRGIPFDEPRLDALLRQFNIFERKDDPVKAYSSGMKQRLKFIFALQHKPPLLIFDEPTSNLDDAGKEAVYATIRSEGKEHIVIVASNETTDLALCESVLNLAEFK